MAKTLSARHKKMKRDKARADKEGTAPRRHKVGVRRSKKAKSRARHRG